MVSPEVTHFSFDSTFFIPGAKLSFARLAPGMKKVESKEKWVTSGETISCLFRRLATSMN